MRTRDQAVRRGVLGRLVARRPARIAAAYLLALLAASSLLPLFEQIAGVSATRVDLGLRLAPPSAQHWLGTDDAGRDLLARFLAGGNVSLLVALTGTVIAAAVGVAFGAAAASTRGVSRRALAAVIDLACALPALPLLIALSAVDLTKLGLSEATAGSGAVSLWRVIALLALLGWPDLARLTLGEIRSTAKREFVTAARGLGGTELRVVLVHLLPNALAPILVAACLLVARMIMAESALSFLGLGIAGPYVSWGAMLNDMQDVLAVAPLQAIWPGLAIAGSIVAINVLGNALRAALDPRRSPVGD